MSAAARVKDKPRPEPKSQPKPRPKPCPRPTYRPRPKRTERGDGYVDLIGWSIADLVATAPPLDPATAARIRRLLPPVTAAPAAQTPGAA